MSGIGGGGGDGERGDVLNCATVQFTTTLTSVQKEVADRLKVGTTLDVGEDDGRVVAVQQGSGELVGSINWAKNGELIRCMEDGYEFIATVREVDDGLIIVQVTSA